MVKHAQHERQHERQHEQQQERLLAILAERSARTGEFTLASGVRSNFYIDARITAMSPDGLALIGPLGLSAIHDAGWSPDAVGGLTLGADPIAYAIAYASALAKLPIRAFTVRKDAKAHGTGKLIEGPLRPSDSVVIIEDVITTGGSALRAIQAVCEFGATILGVLALVDREEGGCARLEQEGYSVHSLVRASEIIPLIC